MTNKILLAAFLGIFIAACSTSPQKDESVEVEDRSTEAGMAGDEADAEGAGDEAQTFAMGDDETSALSQLEDPESLVSVRIIYFDYDSSAVLSQFNEIIEAHANFLMANPNQTTTLEGHADERGSREYNLALGEQRALTVKKQLVVLGVNPAQVRTVSYGEERPADPGHDQQAWGLSRRVEFVY